MREILTYGSVRGARGNPGPYRDPASTAFTAWVKARREIWLPQQTQPGTVCLANSSSISARLRRFVGQRNEHGYEHRKHEQSAYDFGTSGHLNFES